MRDVILFDTPKNSPLTLLAIVLLAFFCGFAALTLHTQYRRGRLRFSLRTLLIAITLVAVMLGFIVWALGSGK